MLMRCLWITRQDPRTADSGELIYSYGLLQSLATQDGIELQVLTHCGAQAKNPTVDLIHWNLTGPIPSKRALGLFSKLPGDADRLGNTNSRVALRKLMKSKKWDWIVIDQAACAWVLEEIASESRAKIAYIAHNHEASLRPEVASYQGASLLVRLLMRYDAAKYVKLEKHLVGTASLVSAITPDDAQRFKYDFPSKQIIILPPGYDEERIPKDLPPPISPDTPRRVVLAGTFHWIAKRRNLEEFLKEAHHSFKAANIELLVAGKADATYFKRLSDLYPWAKFHSNVPSMEPYLANARIGLIPEALGGGFKLKALDYIYRRLPLAAIKKSLSGLPLDPSRDSISAVTTAELVAQVVAHIDHLDFLNDASRQAFLKCRHAFYWLDRGKQLADALRSPTL